MCLNAVLKQLDPLIMFKTIILMEHTEVLNCDTSISFYTISDN